jgi:hypothetical protein
LNRELSLLEIFLGTRLETNLTTALDPRTSARATGLVPKISSEEFWAAKETDVFTTFFAFLENTKERTMIRPAIIRRYHCPGSDCNRKDIL